MLSFELLETSANPIVPYGDLNYVTVRSSSCRAGPGYRVARKSSTRFVRSVAAAASYDGRVLSAK